MRNIVSERAIQMVLIVTAAVMISSCGHHDGSTKNGDSGADGNGGAASATNFGVNSADLGENDMDSNVAQADGANGTVPGGQ